MFEQNDLFGGRPIEEAPSQKHSATSRAAAESVAPSMGAKERAVLAVLKKCGDFGATDEELQDALGMAGNSQRPRRIALVGKGLVRDSGHTRTTRSGHQAAVWVVA